MKNDKHKKTVNSSTENQVSFVCILMYAFRDYNCALKILREYYCKAEIRLEVCSRLMNHKLHVKGNC